MLISLVWDGIFNNTVADHLNGNANEPLTAEMHNVGPKDELGV